MGGRYTNLEIRWVFFKNAWCIIEENMLIKEIWHKLEVEMQIIVLLQYIVEHEFSCIHHLEF